METHTPGIIEGYKELAAAIIGQAVHDFMNALIGEDLRRIREGREFFRSEYFRILSDKVQGEMLIDKCTRIAAEVKAFEFHLFKTDQKDKEAVQNLIDCISDQCLLYTRKHLKRNRYVLKSTKKLLLKEMYKRKIEKYIYFR